MMSASSWWNFARKQFSSSRSLLCTLSVVFRYSFSAIFGVKSIGSWMPAFAEGRVIMQKWESYLAGVEVGSCFSAWFEDELVELCSNLKLRFARQLMATISFCRVSGLAKVLKFSERRVKSGEGRGGFRGVSVDPAVPAPPSTLICACPLTASSILHQVTGASVSVAFFSTSHPGPARPSVRMSRSRMDAPAPKTCR